MVSTPFDALKTSVRQHRKANANLPLSYAAHLEVAVRLSTGAPSINHYKSRQEAFPDLPVPTLWETLSALRECERLIISEPAPTANLAEPDDYLRYERWQLLSEIWLALLDPPIGLQGDQRPLHRLLCLARDIEQMNIPSMLVDGKVLSRTESALAAPDEGWILSAWLFGLEGSCINHWMRLQSAAASFGYGEEASDYYRAVCRESVNHSWHPASAITLGVYDLPVDNPRFFKSGESDEAFIARIERIWRFEEPGAFN